LHYDIQTVKTDLSAYMATTEPAPLLKDQLAGRLRDAIVEGRLRPGERVSEGVWAREFGVAQASVREAINLLIAEGFVVKNSGRSARVTQYTAQDVERIYQLRGAMEGLAAQLAAASHADLSPLEVALARMEAAQQRGDVRDLIASDLAFHLALAHASGNPLLADALSRLLRPLFSFVLLRMIETRESAAKWAPGLPRHRQMIELIRDSPPAIAKQFVEYCVGRFVKSAHAVWWPDAKPRRRNRNKEQP
jgi:DNA-binding GntR family transcriptional regulator